MSMQYANLGRSGLRVSRLALGAMNFGMITDESVSHRILDKALERGINLVDTADVYGGPQAADMAQGYGISEEFIGRWLAKSGRRDDIVLATKVYQPMGLGPNDRPAVRIPHPAGLRGEPAPARHRPHRSLPDASRRPDHSVGRDLAGDGAARWRGEDHLCRQQQLRRLGHRGRAGRRGSPRVFGLVSEQSLYNLTTRAIELEVIPALEYHGIGLIPWSPLAGGVLAGVLEGKSGERRDHGPIQDRVAALQPQIVTYEGLCTELGEEPANVALAWLLHQPAVTSAIIGPRTVEQLGAAQRALDITLDDATAPQAYAW
jgi:aryl-alcohol dehydrogenase-like predicted oxidoreductase